MERDYIIESLTSGRISGDGDFTKKCQSFLERKYSFQKTLLTTSCTDALEMSALILNIKPGDEVIVPSFTFVSTANAFVLRGAKIVFADSSSDHPNIDAGKIESLITNKTKAIVPVHYAGNACDMGLIIKLAHQYGIEVIEDAAQAIDSYFINSDKKKIPLGSIGSIGTFSFHDTKNIICGEGGLIVINNPSFNTRAEIIREKGTNRSAFFRGEVAKYSWVEVGSSFLPSDILSAFLYAQLENIDKIQRKRINIWEMYFDNLKELQNKGDIQLPKLPLYATNNGHAFYFLCQDLQVRTDLINKLKNSGITGAFHYLSLHKSKFYEDKHDGRELPNSDRFSDTLIRLPLFYDLEEEQIKRICKTIKSYFE